MNDEELFMIIGFIKCSRNRIMTMKAIEDDIMMPSEIGRAMDFRTTQASSALIELKKKGLVVCLNDKSYKGRLYTTTERGKEVMKHYNELFQSDSAE